MPGAIRWGVYGAGAIAGRFASDLSRLSGGRLVAVASRSQASARAFATAYDAAAVEDLEALLEPDLVDIVYVATPNFNHLKAALKCIEVGKSVLIEKPIATSSKDAELIADAARARGVFCMEAMWMRFTPGVVRAKALIDAGGIGELRHLSASLHYPQASSASDPLLSKAAPSSLDLGVYPVSLAISLFGAPTAVSGVFIKGETDKDVQAAFSLGWDRQTASLSCGMLAEGDNRATIIGSAGVIELHRQFLSPPFLITRRTNPFSPGEARANMIPKQRPARFANLRGLLQPVDMRRQQLQWTPAKGFGLSHEIEAVHGCLTRGEQESTIAPLQDSILTLQVIEAIVGKS